MFDSSKDHATVPLLEKPAGGSPGSNSGFEINPKSIPANAVLTVEMVPKGETPKSVLVVEDDPAVRQVIEEIISTLGLYSVNANSAAEALASFERCAEDTVCVFLDYGVPGMHTLQLLTRFKELRADIPVILSSGYPESYISNDIPSLWIDGFIAKPFDSQTLIGTLQRVIKRRNRSA